jgi:pimeloyl-ACP methyl ester carboxylesterase
MRIARIARGFAPWRDVWVRSTWRVQLQCVTGHARLLDPARRVVAEGNEGECLEEAARRAPHARRRRGVVLLHGILNDPSIMLRAAHACVAAEWAVANVGYPSTRLPLAAHAAAASQAARALAEDGATEISFIGHSLGGLVAASAMARAAADGWAPGRLVLVGTPARGSTMAGMLRRLPGYTAFLGPCGEVLTQAGAAGVAWPHGRQIAVIAGGNGRRGFNPLLAGDNDFTVTVAETRLGARESGFLRVRALHNGLAEHRETIGAALSFLATGRLHA